VYELTLLIPKVNLSSHEGKRENAARREVLMYLLLRNENRGIVDGVLLAAGRNAMRLAIPGEADTLELRLSDGAWFSAAEKFELEALIVEAEGAMASLDNALPPKTLAAGMPVAG
jgi:hypothetical protein